VEATAARVTRSKSGSVKVLANLVSNLEMNGSLDDSEKWVQCDGCGAWWDLSCACIEENIAETRFVCDNC